MRHRRLSPLEIERLVFAVPTIPLHLLVLAVPAIPLHLLVLAVLVVTMLAGGVVAVPAANLQWCGPGRVWGVRNERGERQVDRGEECGERQRERDTGTERKGQRQTERE
jgi:hypothetical protein